MIANIKCFKLCAIVVLSLVVSYCTAQDQADTLTYYIQTTDGNTYHGANTGPGFAGDSIPVSKEKFNLGGGALLGTVLGAEETGFGILYGISTLGSKDKNVSLGL